MMRGLTIERTASVLLFALIFALAARVPVDTDTWWHLRSGDHMLTQGFIYTDPFSHTMQSQPWINHSWGAQIILLAFWRIGGYLGLTIYMASLATAGMYVLFRMSAGSAYVRAFVIVIGATAAAVFWSPRPQMISFFLSTIVLYLLYLYKVRRIDRVWLLIPLMALWGNLHAGFSIGFIILGGFIAGEGMQNLLNPQSADSLGWRKLGRLVVVAVLSAGALAINPYGLNMLLVPFQTVGIGALRSFIQEWNSPNFQERQTWGFIILLFGTLGAIGASKKPLAWSDFILLTGTGFLALTAGRNIAVFSVIAVPVFAYHVDAALRERGWIVKTVLRPSPLMARVNALIVVLAILGAGAKTLLVLDDQIVEPELRRVLPVEAVEYIRRERPADPIFNSYNWGGYLVYTLPDYPVFVDGRTDLYGDALLTRYLQTALGSPGWEDTLTEYAINLVLVETGSGLALRLLDDPAWSLVYDDPLASIYVRETA